MELFEDALRAAVLVQIVVDESDFKLVPFGR
jgi:hypothetical protein